LLLTAIRDSRIVKCVDALIALVETKEFQRKSERGLSDEERSALLGHLAQHPDAGDVIPETGGIRKLRWGREARASAAASE